MNKVVLMGRLTKDPDVRYSQAEPPLAIARFTLAVDRRFRRQSEGGDEQTADFISCVAFGKTGEFIEKYAHKGTKFTLSGRIQTGRYTNKDGQTVYTTEVVCDEVEFAESKSAQSANAGGSDSAHSNAPAPSGADDGFMNVPDEIDDDMPFN
jgi:single-strand DNA-binding protein